MPSNNLDDVIVSVVAAHSRTVDFAGTQTILLVNILQQMLVIFLAGLFSTVFDTTGRSSKDIQWVIEQLKAAGYTTSYTGTSLTISW